MLVYRMKMAGLIAAVAVAVVGGSAQAQSRPVRVQFSEMLRTSTSFLGVNVQEVDAEGAQRIKLKDVHGVEIVSVEENSPASKAGLLKGDVVLEYQGQRVEGTEQFVRLVRETPAGRQVKLSIHRDGKEQNVAATIGTRKSSPDVLSRTLPQFTMPDLPRMVTSLKSGMLGIEAEGVDGQMAAYFGVKQGVLVRSVTKDSAADRAGMKAGDVITKVGNETVESPRELTSAIRAAQARGEASIVFVRDRRESSVVVKLEQGAGSPQKPRGVNRAEIEADQL